MGIFNWFKVKRRIKALKAEEDIEGLINALKYEKDEHVQMEAARALGMIKNKRAVEPLIQFLKESNTNTQLKAIWALTYMDTKESMEAFGDYLDECEDVKRQTGIRKDSEGRMAICEVLGTVKGKQTKIGDILIKALLDDDTCVIAARVIRDRVSTGTSVDVRAVEPLNRVLQKSYFPGQRREAARALGCIGDTRAVNYLKKALHDEDGDVRYAAAEALELIKVNRNRK